MPSKTGRCFALLFTIILTACQKEPLIADRDFKTLGLSAQDLLSASRYTALNIEVNYMPGYEPDATSLNNLKSFLNTHIHKPGGIQIRKRPITASGKPSLSLEDIVLLEKRNRTLFTQGDVIAVHILITDQEFSNSGLLGLSYWNTSICIFGKTLFDHSDNTGQVSSTRLMSTLLQHEFGHLLGLVNQGSPMSTDHKDEDNGAHCNNAACLMFYGIETTDNTITQTTDLPSLDDHCINDLKANGGK